MADDDLPHGKEDENKSNKNKQNTTDHPQHLDLDLGDDLSRKSDRVPNPSNSAREDNPFSFKHFLRSDSTSYQNKGARPKVYNTENRSISLGGEGNNHDSIPELKSNHRIVPEYSSALPDFVQDHLVIEQCYLGNNTNNFNHLDINNLPDFTHNSNRNNFEPSHSPLDEQPVKDTVPIPLDLPVRPDNFPLDLPINPSSNGRNTEVGNSKSLPDFLADSQINNPESNSNNHSPETENDRLRLEIGLLRRQLAEQTRRADNLSRELDIARSKEHDYTQNLARALEQVELNLEKSKRRAASAENTTMKLKQEISSLKAQINHLQFENKTLKGEEAAGGFGYHPAPSNDLHSQRLAHELRAAASTAEHSLRQLLTGVDNLRMMASTLENRHRIEEERNDHPFMDSDKDAGPAL